MRPFINAGKLSENAATKSGISLDRMTCTGPRGGRITMWRASSKRLSFMAAWHDTQAQAAKYAEQLEAIAR